MKTKLIAALWLALLSFNSAFALELMPEDELSQATGQDGVTILVGLPAAGWTASQVTLLDKTGIVNTVKPGFDFHAATLLARNVGVKTCTESAINGACTSIATASIQLVFDTVGDIIGGGGSDSPMLNISLSLINGANKFRFYIDKIALRNGSGANEVTILDIVHSDGVGDYVDIAPVGGGTLLTLQLGNEASGRMVNLTNANFGSIDFGQLVIRDKTDTLNGGACAACNIRFGFRLDSVNLTGSGFDLDTQGLTYSAASFVTPMDITFSNIAVGNTITGANTATDMGTIGIKGLQVTNFALTLSGKS